MEHTPIQYEAYAQNPEAYKDGLSPAVLAGNGARAGGIHDRVRSRTKEEREEEKAAMRRSVERAADTAKKIGADAKKATGAVLEAVESQIGENGVRMNFPVVRGGGEGGAGGIDARTIKVFICDNGDTVPLRFYVA